MKLVLALLAITVVYGSFVSQEYEQFQGKSHAELQKYLGLHLTSLEHVPKRSYQNFLRLVNLPDAFDTRTQWPGCVHAIRDQGQCGSCWAFAGSETLSDRFCIASNSASNNVLSPQYMVSCDTTNYACNGGYLDKEWYFLEAKGTVTDACWPYQSGSGSVPKCRTTCVDGSAMQFYKSVTGSLVELDDVTSIKMELMANGPVETGFTVYQDFMNYKSGIYKRKSSVVLGGHAVKIVGWGVENGVNYWICANSWSTSWGEQGFFRIAFGQCGIDKDVVAGTASV